VLLVVVGLALIVANGLGLRAQRRYTHSRLWRATIERVRAGHPSLILGWQRYDGLFRAINRLGLALGACLVMAGLVTRKRRSGPED
jgi:hypothetical protein